jgi:hypothetical protein
VAARSPHPHQVVKSPPAAQARNIPNRDIENE